MAPRNRERLGGLFVSAVGAALFAYNWHIARTDGRYYVKSSFLGPAAIVLGLALLVFPSPKLEREMKRLPAIRGAGEITPRWWAILLAAMALGGVNLYVLSRGLPW